MDYVIAVPSYRRATICKDQTLTVLEKLKVSKDRIHVFVADEEEEKTYRSVLGDDYKIIVGVRGISDQRKFYHNYFPVGTRIVSIDDDMAELLQLDEVNKALVPTPLTLDEIVEIGYSYAEKEGAKLWGINPTMNHFFLKNQISVGLRYICANFMGSYAGDWIFTDPNRRMTHTGEDHHSTLRAFVKYGCVVRLEFLCPKTKYFAAGGIDACVTEDGQKRAERHADELGWVQKQYSELCTIQVKAGGVVNIRFKPITYARYKFGKTNG